MERHGSGLFWIVSIKSPHISRKYISTLMGEIGAENPILPVATPISGSTGSRQAFRQAYRWLEKCVKEHKTMCPRLVSPDGPPKLPSRVLDLSSETQNVKLLVTEGKVGYWACLSHCWGGEQPLKTTRGTLSKHQESISWTDLPKTFQDAIVVTRALGIPYLWIDSLCIVQGDTGDWDTESARMADIYHKSILTIAGSASPGPHQGIFREADASHIDQPIPAGPTNTIIGKARTRKALTHYASDLPLLTRGWVHQERLLSPRILHFSHNELIWECMEHLTCECHGLNLSDSTRLQWLAPKDRLHPYSLQLVNWMMRRGPPVWHAVVADYTRMNLTKAEDILPAISGLAKTVIKTTGWEYVAGMWKENLIVDLTWSTKRPHLAKRRRPWQAPTFSWASIISKDVGKSEAAVSYDHMDILRQGLEGRKDERRCTDFYASVVDVSCTPAGEDPTGRLKSAHVVLRGTLIRCSLRRLLPSNEWHVTAVNREPKPENRFAADVDLMDASPNLSGHNDEVHCLRLIGTTKRVEFEDEEFLAYLVLRKVTLASAGARDGNGDEHCTFERLGLMVNWRGVIQLEDESNVEDIARDALVRIV